MDHIKALRKGSAKRRPERGEGVNHMRTPSGESVFSRTTHKSETESGDLLAVCEPGGQGG